MAKKRKSTGKKSWLMPEDGLDEAAKTSIQKTSTPKTVKEETTPPASVSERKPKEVNKPVPTKTKQKPGPKGLGENLKICRLTTSAHKQAKRMAFETEETLTEYLSRIVKEDYEANYDK